MLRFLMKLKIIVSASSVDDAKVKGYKVSSIASRIAIHLVLAAILCFPPSSSEGADPAVERIQDAYQGIRDARGSFIQKSHIIDLERTDTFKGSFIIKMPAKMRWQYRGDDKETEVVINGEEIIIYQKKEKQAFKGRFDRQTYGQAPIALLGGFGSIEKEFDVTRKGEKILLKPKREMGTVVSIEITPSDGAFPIASMTIIDKRSNRIDITLKDVRVNSGLNDGAFDFSLPKGASIYENK